MPASCLTQECEKSLVQVGAEQEGSLGDVRLDSERQGGLERKWKCVLSWGGGATGQRRASWMESLSGFS